MQEAAVLRQLFFRFFIIAFFHQIRIDSIGFLLCMVYVHNYKVKNRDKNVKNIQNTLAILLRSDYNKTHEACLKECRTGKTRKRRMRV